MNRPKKTSTNANQADAEQLKEIKSHLMTTGLEDYGFWWQEMIKQQAQKTEPEKPFRRGRIWC